MSTQSATIVQRVWNYCNVLRDDFWTSTSNKQFNKVNLDIFWLRDESLEDTANLPDPDVLALETVEDLQVALEQFGAIAEDLGTSNGAG